MLCAPWIIIHISTPQRLNILINKLRLTAKLSNALQF